MRTRHRLPSLVSMWMLDVFCCALGCVILLLLLKMREATIVGEEAAQVSNELADTQLVAIDELSKNLLLNAETADLKGKLALVQTERDQLAQHLAVVRSERESAAKRLALTETAIKAAEAELLLSRQKMDDNAKALASAKERATATADELAKKNADLAELARKSSDVRKTSDELQQLLREKEKLRADLLRQNLDLSERLLAAENKLAMALKQVDDLAAKSTEKEKLRTKVNELEKQIADANVAIVDLQGTKAKLADKINKLETDSEQRFAGIVMSGKRVVFLVDMSGSMDRTDENTINPEKWPFVRDTLIKVMRSIPDLEQYQLILFSSKVSYALGNEGQWLKYEREKSVEQVRKAMTATKPVADTNLYVALEETFKFRSKGLDTIYFFSDGLPTSGPGLTPTEDKTVTGEAERGVLLARYLRKIFAPPGTRRATACRASASIRSASSTKAPTSAPSSGPSPAKMTEASWGCPSLS